MLTPVMMEGGSRGNDGGDYARCRGGSGGLTGDVVGARTPRSLLSWKQN